MKSTEPSIPISVGILTLNCKDALAKAFASVERFEDKYICDGNSTDGTQDVARQFGARIVRQADTDEPNQKITDFGAARTKCVNAALRDWYFRLDSDEYLSEEAVQEIARIVADPNPPHRIYKIPRKYVFHGKIIDDTITYPNRQVRLFRRDAVDGYTKLTHEKIVIRPNETVGLMTGVMYVPLPDSFAALDDGRTKRALDWDRRHYEATITPRKWAWGLLHTTATMALFLARSVRVRLISRGNKLPLALEWWRFKYLFLTNVLSTRILLRRLFFDDKPSA